MIFPEALKQILYKLKKQDLIELLDSFFWNVEEYQEERRQHLVDRQKIIFYKDREIDRQEREIEWQKNTLRSRTRRIFELESEVKDLKEHTKTTKH